MANENIELNHKALKAAADDMLYNDFGIMANKSDDFLKLAELAITSYLKALPKVQREEFLNP